MFRFHVSFRGCISIIPEPHRSGYHGQGFSLPTKKHHPWTPSGMGSQCQVANLNWPYRSSTTNRLLFSSTVDGWEKSQTTTQHVWNPVNNGKFSILSTGAGFLKHQAVVHVSSPNSKIWNPKSCEPLVGRCFFSFHSFRGEFSDAPVDGWCTMVESVKISPWTNIIMD